LHNYSIWITLPLICFSMVNVFLFVNFFFFKTFVNFQYIWCKYRLIHGHFHIGLAIMPRTPYWPETESRANMGRGMITRPIWKCPCIKLFITYFQHLEKRHPYWPETKSRPILARVIWASIWKWSCSNPITGYFPGVWKYGQFTSGHIGHTKLPLFELNM
jgi:hypothetical protein